MDIHVPGQLQHQHIVTELYSPASIAEVQASISKQLKALTGDDIYASEDMIKTAIYSLAVYEFPFINGEYVKKRVTDNIVAGFAERYHNILAQSEQFNRSVTEVKQPKARSTRRSFSTII